MIHSPRSATAVSVSPCVAPKAVLKMPVRIVQLAGVSPGSVGDLYAELQEANPLLSSCTLADRSAYGAWLANLCALMPASVATLSDDGVLVGFAMSVGVAEAAAADPSTLPVGAAAHWRRCMALQREAGRRAPKLIAEGRAVYGVFVGAARTHRGPTGVVPTLQQVQVERLHAAGITSLWGFTTGESLQAWVRSDSTRVHMERSGAPWDHGGWRILFANQIRRMPVWAVTLTCRMAKVIGAVPADWALWAEAAEDEMLIVSVTTLPNPDVTTLTAFGPSKL